MGIGDLLGLGKKEKVAFRAPREVSELRTRIDAEQRENFPNAARFQEITQYAKQIIEILQDTVAQKEHSAEATKIIDDIKNRLAKLADKIEKNKREANKEGKQDYVEKKIDYLERRSTRNSAKTLFIDFLDSYEVFIACCKDGKPGQGEAMHSAAVQLLKVMSELHHNFFKKHGQDTEISGLRDKILEKISALDDVVRENERTLESSGLKERALANLYKLKEAAAVLSEK
jgi:predicted ribosome quality control (RQC) complex YloA/Tae2 family protein